MNKEWLKKVIKTQKESAYLQTWCENIGYDRYEKIYTIIKDYTGNDRINYAILKAVAKYDFCLSDMLHSMIKFIELRFRAFLTNEYGCITITKDYYLYEISNALSGGDKRLDCSTYYDRKLKDKTTLGEFLDASSMETLLRVFFLLPDEKLKKFDNDLSKLKSNLEKIKEMRNYVAHGQLVIKNNKFNLKELIVLMLKYMPTKETKIKRVKELEKLNNRLFHKESQFPDALFQSIAIVLTEKDKQIIGL